MAKMMSSRDLCSAALCTEIGKLNLLRQDFLAKPYFQSKQVLVLLSKIHFGGKILEVWNIIDVGPYGSRTIDFGPSNVLSF